MNILDMRRQGLTLEEIAQAKGISRAAVLTALMEGHVRLVTGNSAGRANVDWMPQGYEGRTR